MNGATGAGQRKIGPAKQAPHTTDQAQTKRHDTFDGPPLAWHDPRLLMAIALLFVFCIGVALFNGPRGSSGDLRAVWTAGQFWQMGRLDEIYASSEGLFTMLPPQAWSAWISETQGGNGGVFPYLYPPLWAVLMGTVAPSDFAQTEVWAGWLNISLLAATVVLAIRATGAMVHPVVHVAIVLLLATTTHVFAIAYAGSQPQILVSFLIVLAIERSRAGASRAAGIALALAASIKIYPALFALIWLARGQYRAALSFCVAGFGLAALSVLLAGWPLHEAFLGSIRQISRTLLITGGNASFDVLVGQVFLMGDAHFVQEAGLASSQNQSYGWYVAERPFVWAIIYNIALVATLVGTMIAARNVSEQALYAGLWPMFLTLMVPFAPTGWVYYLIPSAVFAPALLASQNARQGGLLFLVGMLLLYGSRLILPPGTFPYPFSAPFFTVTGALFWTAGFCLMARERSQS